MYLFRNAFIPGSMFRINKSISAILHFSSVFWTLLGCMSCKAVFKALGLNGAAAPASPAPASCVVLHQPHTGSPSPVQIVRNGGGQLEQGGIAFHYDTDVIDVGYLQVSPVHHQYSLCIHSCSVNITFICTCMQGDRLLQRALAMLQLSSAIT